VQEFLAGSIDFNVHGSIGTTRDLLNQRESAILLEAEKFSKLALDELQNDCHNGILANHQRASAQICVMKVRRLEQLLKAASDSTEETEGFTMPDMPSNPVAEIREIRRVGLEKIKEAEEIYSSREAQASWLDGLQGVDNRQSILNFHASFFTIQTGIDLLQAEPGGVTQETVSEVWEWVQKYKARSLARSIGMIRGSDPPELVRQILASTDTRPLYETMLDLEQRIDLEEKRDPKKQVAPGSNGADAIFDLRRQLDTHRRRMKDHHPLLRLLIDLREGTPLGLSDVAAVSSQGKSRVVLVDWYYVPPYYDDGKLLLFTARADSPPTMDVLTTTIDEVTSWRKEHLNPGSLRLQDARHTFDRLLGGLVVPLAHRVAEAEVLVLCPSTTLHRLPLHALSITTPVPEENDETELPLIVRNPVIYINSHSLLRSSMSSTEQARDSQAAVNAHFMAGISEADATGLDERGKPRDHQAGRSSIETLARQFGTLPTRDQDASKKKFMSAATKSRLLHLHTHCNWDFANPLDHNIQFPRLEERSAEEQKLTVRETFGIRLLRGTHVNLIACQGGVTDIKCGDEVMGLVPALLYAGASSTISTLWSIPDGDGAEFSKLFFDSLLQQCAELSAGSGDALVRDERGEKFSPFVDLARALQQAVTDMYMEQDFRKGMLPWAGFVLHGFWQFPLSDGDVRRRRLQSHKQILQTRTSCLCREGSNHRKAWMVTMRQEN
jgi:CHAT domain-containing protein